jgi:hypothetical protein
MTEEAQIRRATQPDLPEILALHAQLARPGEDATPLSIEAASAILRRIAVYPNAGRPSAILEDHASMPPCAGRGSAAQ